MHNDLLEIQDLDQVLERADSITTSEIIRQAEKFLDSQLQAALASDQRAVTFASVVGAIAGVLLAAYVAASASPGGPGALGLVGLPVIAGLLTSLALAALVFRPTDWHFAGSNPRHWRKDIESGKTFAMSQAGQAKLYARGIILNREILKLNATLMTWALGVAVATFAVGIIMAVVTLGTSRP